MLYLWETVMRSKQSQIGTLKPPQHLLEEELKQRKPVSIWLDAGPSGGYTDI
jgi:hypothetical protein